MLESQVFMKSQLENLQQEDRLSRMERAIDLLMEEKAS